MMIVFRKTTLVIILLVFGFSCKARIIRQDRDRRPTPDETPTEPVQVIPTDETLTWGELVLDIKNEGVVKNKVSDLLKEKCSNLFINARVEDNAALFDELIAGIIQDVVTAHLLANIIKQKADLKPGEITINPEDTSTKKNESTASIESYIEKYLKKFSLTWSTLTGRLIQGRIEPVKAIKTYIIPAVKARLILIINIADEILAEHGINDGYKKIYGHVYKSTPAKDATRDQAINTLAQDLAVIYSTYYYETKNPKMVIPATVLHIFHFSWLRDLYLPSVRLRKASELFFDKPTIEEN